MTLIRNTITRLLSVTESAKKSFDNLGLTMDGTYLSFNRFSKEAGKNVYKAFDVLTSQLDKFKADGDILREMFTMRNWATILPMLQEMNGNTAEFVKNYVEGESALEGYNTQLKSLGNEVLVLKQSFTALMDGAITPFKDIMVGFISLLEKTIDSLKGLNESSKRFWSGLAVDITSTTVAISGLTFVAVGLFHLFKTVIAQETVKLLFNPITASLMILGISMSTLYRHLKTLKKVEENRLENIKKLTKETKKFNEEIGTSERLTKKYQEELKKLEDVEINKTWINANADIENVIKSTEEYANIIKNMDTAFKINLDIKSPSQIREEKIAFEKKYSREGGQLGLEATPTLDAEKEFNILKRKKEKLDELMPLYKKYDESEKKIIELMHTYYKTKEQEVSYENAITDSRKLKLKIKELGGVENPDIKELEVQQKEYTKLVVEEIAKRKKAEEDYASKRATDLRTLQELFKTINTDINGVYAKDLTTMYEINPEKYAKQYKAMYKEIFEYVDKYGTKIGEDKKIKTITSSHFQEMATGLKQFGDLYKKETTIIQDTLSPKELEKLYGIAKLKGGVTLENREKFSKKTAEEIERIVEKYLELDTATKTSTETLRDNVAILKNTEKKAKEYAGALNMIATTTDKATGSNKKFSKSLSGLKDYDIKENLINPLERLKKNTELEKLAFDLDIIKEKLEEIDGVTSDNIGTKMKELLYKDGKLKTPTNGKWDKLTGKFKFNNEEDAIKWQETLDSIGMTTKQYEEFVALTIKEKETQEEIDKIKKEQADRQAELNKNAKELVENYGKTDLEIAQNKLQSLMGMREVSKDMLSTTLGLFMIDGKISDEELEKLQTMENILNLTEKQTEEYKQQYDIINQIKDTASVFGEMFGTDISSVVNPITDIFGDNGSLSKYKTADKASKNKNLSEADLQQAGKDKLMASADIATSVINSFDSVYDQIIGAEIKQSERNINELEMRKQLITDEEELARIDRQILDEKKHQIDLQTQQQTNGMVASGMMSGAGLGASLGGVGGAVVGAVVGGIGGLFGKSQAEKEAEYQKEMLEAQEKQRILLEQQLKVINANNEALINYFQKGSKYGADYANRDFKYTSSNITVTDSGKKLSGRDLTVTNDYKSEIIEGMSNFEDFINTTFTEYEEAVEATNNARNDFAPYKEKGENYKYTEGRYYNGSERDKSDFYKEYDKYLKAYIEASNLESILWQKRDDAIEKEKEMQEIKLKYQKEWFGFEFEETTLADGSKTYTEKEWGTRLNILNSMLEASNEGLSNIGNTISNTLSAGVLNNYIKEVSTISAKGGLLDQLQTDFEGMSTAMANGEDLIKEIQKGHSRTYYIEVNQHLKDAIKHTSQLKDEQIKVNEENQKFLDVWVLAGGEISDVKDNLIGGLYDEMQGIFNAKSYEDGIDGIGSYLYNTISSKSIENILNDKFSQSIVNLNKSIFDTMGNISISSAQSLMNETRALAIQMDSSRQQMGVLKDIMSDNSGIEYKDSSRNIQYETGTTQSIINNTYITNTATINDSIGFSEDAGYAIATALMPYVEKVISER